MKTAINILGALFIGSLLATSYMVHYDHKQDAAMRAEISKAAASYTPSYGHKHHHKRGRHIHHYFDAGYSL